MKNPIQPTYIDDRGVRRFKPNALVQALLDHGTATGFSLNDLAMRFSSPEHDDDRRQFAQLIGYSVSGFWDLSYVDSATLAVIEKIDAGVGAAQARIDVLEDTLTALRTGMRDAVATLYDICPGDLDR